MIPIACGACGVSVLSSKFPPFEIWALLLPVAFVAYHIVLWWEEKLTSRVLVTNILKALLAFALAAMMLSFIIIPLAFLMTGLIFLGKLFTGDRRIRALAATVLALYAASGFYTFAQAREQGKFWQMSRLQGGSPGMAYFTRVAQENVFSYDELIWLLTSNDPTVVRNAAEALKVKARYESDPQQAHQVVERLKALERSGDYRHDRASLAEEFERSVKIPDIAIPTPAATPVIDRSPQKQP